MTRTRRAGEEYARFERPESEEGPLTARCQLVKLLGLARKCGGRRLDASCRIALDAGMVDVYRLAELVRLDMCMEPPPAQLIPLARYLRYLSLFFKRHRAEYYRRLNAVRIDGDWEGWLDFFLDGVATTADETITAARELFSLVATDRKRVLALETTSLAALRLFELLPRHPVVTAGTVRRLLKTTKPTAGRAVEALMGAGVLFETTGKLRGRAYSYRAISTACGTERTLMSERDRPAPSVRGADAFRPAARQGSRPETSEGTPGHWRAVRLPQAVAASSLRRG